MRPPVSADPRFEEPCPPLTETFSFRRLPCLLEQQSCGALNEVDPGRRSCPEMEYCQASSRALVPLENAYGSWIKVTLAEPSSSIVVRSEHQFNKQERRRLGLRKHLFELSSRHGPSLSRQRRQNRPFLLDEGFVELVEELAESSKTTVPSTFMRALKKCVGAEYLDFDSFRDELARHLSLQMNAADQFWLDLVASHAFPPADCYRMEDEDRFGHYLGFLDLRPNSWKSPLALGVLGLPRRFRHNPDAQFITGNYGPLFGGPAFAGTVYSMHDPKTGGAPCAQACAIMALGMLADRGARISGNYTLTYLANRGQRQKHQAGDTAGAENGHLGHDLPAGRVRFSFKARDAGLTPRQLELVLNERGVSARLFDAPADPANARLVRKLVEANIMARFPMILAVDSQTWWPWRKEVRHAGHAVVVVGYRRLANHPGELSLITHDPGFIPFYERPFDDCKDACAAYSSADKFHIVVVAPRFVTVHAHQVLKSLSREPDFEPYPDPAENSDYRIALVVRDDLADRIYARPAYPRVQRRFVWNLQRAFNENLPRTAYWCVAGMKDHRIKRAWLFDVRGFCPAGPLKAAAKLVFEDEKQLSFLVARRDAPMVKIPVA